MLLHPVRVNGFNAPSAAISWSIIDFYSDIIGNARLRISSTPNFLYIPGAAGIAPLNMDGDLRLCWITPVIQTNHRHLLHHR